MKSVLKALALASIMVSSIASASVLNARVHADNFFTAYISTSDAVDGAAFLRGDVWEQAYAGTTNLMAGQDYYLHIAVTDTWGVAGLLGQFSLIDSTHQFANGEQTLLTNTLNWTGNNSGFNGSYVALGDYGSNGTGGNSWSVRDGMASNAQWIWAGSSEWNDNAYFTTKISAIEAPADVPEPGSLALMGLGLAGFAVFNGRRRKA